MSPAVTTAALEVIRRNYLTRSLRQKQGSGEGQTDAATTFKIEANRKATLIWLNMSSASVFEVVVVSAVDAVVAVSVVAVVVAVVAAVVVSVVAVNMFPSLQMIRNA
ncbi:hypothetical protein HELRODRAFT_167575 [Helobdella robusta]|uniref:Uncharacterized protein n=1 Tax=Helobdella robusta TaxID=6412 RepID=T1EZI4_HELRO|nr:hypothetical protein HELRODRAFT_167575 [Helobdella robusta]ESO11054.1 hypothetical protein HELRODRAFT_167575 [Helobdella robusta]